MASHRMLLGLDIDVMRSLFALRLDFPFYCNIDVQKISPAGDSKSSIIAPRFTHVQA